MRKPITVKKIKETLDFCNVESSKWHAFMVSPAQQLRAFIISKQTGISFDTILNDCWTAVNENDNYTIDEALLAYELLSLK